MKRFIKNLWANKVFRTVLDALVVCLILLAVFVYFVAADISQAPTFIYSQF